MAEETKQSWWPWWHVAWATFLAWAPTDRRGSWELLSNFYADLAASGESVEMSSPLPAKWQGRAEPPEVRRLTPLARDMAKRSILELAGSDRIAGDTPIRAVAVSECAVQLLLACPEGSLHQRVGRLKSRSATDLDFDRRAPLAFDPGAGVGGRGTWARGFWWAKLTSKGAVAAAEGFIVKLG